MSGGILTAIGNTPLVPLNRVIPDLHFRLFAKLEALNQGGSGKHRWASRISGRENADAHHETVREIVTALEQEPGYLFCATGSCGTLRGCVDYVRAHGLTTKIIAVDAVGSVIFGQKRAQRLIPGHGSAIIPELF